MRVEPAPVAVVLCGGQGTRLRAVLSDRPKSLAPLAGRPFLEWLLLQLKREGVRRVVLAAGHLGGQISEHFQDGFAGIELQIAIEDRPLGTGGAVRHAAEMERPGELLVMNGDSYCPFDLRRLRRQHSSRGGAATLWLAPVRSRGRFGAVSVDGDGRVTGFGEKEEQDAGLANAGIYLLAPDAVAAIPVPSSLEREVLPGLVGRGLYAVAGEGRLVDIGTPDSLAAAEAELGSELQRLGVLA